MTWSRVLSLLEFRGRLQPTWGSLLRISAWCIAGLMIVALVIPSRPGDPTRSPYQAQLSSPAVYEIGAPRGDERGFYPSQRSNDQFRIAWVAGSSIQGVDPERRTFVPAELQHQLHTINGREVSIDIYFLSGMRIIDELGAVIKAIDSNPDMLVVTLNPLWVLNDRAIQGWDNLDGQLFIGAGTSPKTWPLLLSIVSPSDILWASAGLHVNAFEDRYHWGVKLRDQFGDWSPLEIQPRTDPGEEPPELAQVAAMQIPVFFWDKYDNIVSDDVQGPNRQAASFKYVVESRSPTARAALRSLLDRIKESGIPTYLYLAQYDDEIVAQPVVDQALDAVEDDLAKITAQYLSNLVVMRTESAIRAVGDMDFRDAIHVYDVAPLTEHLYSELCEFTQSQGWEASCDG